MPYNGNIELISGLIQKNNGSFPLVDASAVRVDDETDLNSKLDQLDLRINSIADIFGGDSSSTATKRILIPEVNEYGYLYDFSQNKEVANAYGEYCIFEIEPNTKYYICGSSWNTISFPLGGFMTESGSVISSFGADIENPYEEYAVTSPLDAAKLIVNRSLYVQEKEISVYSTKITSGIQTIDDILSNLTEIENSLYSIKQKLISKTDISIGDEITATEAKNNMLYNSSTNQEVSNSGSKYARYSVIGSTYYYVTGKAHSNGTSFPLIAWLDSNGNVLDRDGTTANEVYTNEKVFSPADATAAIVNASSGATYALKNAFLTNESRSDIIDDADVRLAKYNPFTFKPYDKGYISVFVDGMHADIDKVAAIFEEYGFPLNVAANVDNLDKTCNGITVNSGSYVAGMTTTQVCKTVQKLGGEIFAANSAVIDSANQYDYRYMHNVFVETKRKLTSKGLRIRGFVGLAEAGAVTGTNEIEKWLTKNYDYATNGTAANYILPRETFDRPAETLQIQFANAISNNLWLIYSILSFDETTLRNNLTAARSAGLQFVTVGYMYDTFGTTFLEKAMSSKVDKEEGKSLSSNDFTNGYKNKLDLIHVDDESGMDIETLSNMTNEEIDGIFTEVGIK